VCSTSPAALWDASEERIWEITNRIGADGRKAVAYYDLTFSAPKSVSVYYAGLLAAGRSQDAERLLDVHRAAVDKAMGYVQTQAAYTRTGYHGRTRDGRSVGVYEEAKGLVGIRFDHRTSRAQEPQLHSHFAVLNRVTTSSDGKIRALDGRGFSPIVEGADAIYLKDLERGMEAGFEVVFGLRPDGKAREIMGVDQRLLTEASSQRGQVLERSAVLVAEYRARWGHEPGPAAMKSIRQAAALETRADKTSLAPEEQIMNWNGTRFDRLATMLSDTAERVRTAARGGHPDQRGYELRAREQVLAAAVAAVQVKYATWTVGNLIKEIKQQQDQTPAVTGDPNVLVLEVLGDGFRYGVVSVAAPDPGVVPVEVQRPDGKSDYRAVNDDRYSTAGQLRTELAVVAAAGEVGAPALEGPELELARVELIAAGLGPDQLAAAMGILSSGRRGDVLIGAAGTGKSRTVGALVRVWEHRVGGRVIGLATSQNATNVLIEDGLTAINTSVFLAQYAPDQHGHVADHVRAGDLFIVDEAGMAGTSELDAIARIVHAGGGKVLHTGDPKQVDAVGAGGILDLMVRDNGCFELGEIHRLNHAWERDASTGLRVGDQRVLGVYQEHGRLRGGTLEEVSDAAVHGYLADTVAGKSSVLVVRTNQQATELSEHIRGELIRLGRVSTEGLGTLRDGNLVGVGDVIQARRNDPTLRVEGNGMVTNRETYTVLGQDPWSGALQVADRTGIVAYLPANYLAEHVTLAYATTVHAVQGRTVDTSHALIDQHSALSGVYVALTRGRQSNTAYLRTQHAPDHHDVERLDTTPRAVLEQILDRDRISEEAATSGFTAEWTRRVGEESGRSLASVGTQWDLLTSEHGKAQYTEVLTGVLDEQLARRLLAEPGFNQLVHAVRASELAGHDPKAVLREAVTERGLGDVDSLSDVLRWRINKGRDQRLPEREVRAGDWASLTTPIPGPAGQYAQVLAGAASKRQAELGVRALDERPAWALAQLGEPPTDQLQLDEWVRRAGIVAAYRDLAAVPENSLSLGAAPAGEQVFHRALWQQAYAAAGSPTEDLDYLRASDGELRAMREVWRREQTWAPYFVGEEITDARLAAAAFGQDVVLWRADAQLHEVGSPQRERIEADIAAAEQAATSSDARAQHLQAIHGARADWTRESEPARIRHEKAGEELERRGLDRDLAPVVVEQSALFEAIVPDPTTATRERDENQESLDLDLDSASRDEAMDPITVTREPQHRGQARDQQEHTLDPDQVIDEAQEVLFTAIPRAEDLAAAEPLRTVVAADPALEDGLGPVTVGEARRQAEISTAARLGRGVCGRDVREWELDLDDAEAAANAARSGRDLDDALAHTLGHTLTRGAGPNTGPELGTGVGRGMSR
jgi:conjugative relaxase-like TrwC/TraI family protein